MSTKRDLSFDFLKTFAIFLMVWGHCMLHLSSADAYQFPLYRHITSFHMQLFMMISGYFALRSMSMPAVPVCVKKARQLLLPCVTGSIVFLAVASVTPPIC